MRAALTRRPYAREGSLPSATILTAIEALAVKMVQYARDFQEIAHCGGEATFSVRCDADGRRSVASGFRHSRPTPASWIGIYALSSLQALPMGDFQMGGIGQGFTPPCPPGCLPVFLGSDSQQKWGHQCPQCRQYFRNSSHSTFYPLTCPYCGVCTGPFQFLTEAQRRYVSHYMETFLGAFEQGDGAEHGTRDRH